jgi:general secretion pathway protein K
LRLGREAGYAMVVAVAGMMAFAYISFEAVAVNRGAIAAVAGQVERARLEAAAEAGIAVAVHGVGIEDPQRRWNIDGTPRTMALGDMILTIEVEDERGKIPINRLDEDQIRMMFSTVGATGDRLNILVDSFEDWQDQGDDARPNGAKAPYYLPFGIKPRSGPFRSVDELSEIRGMDDALFERLKPALTVFFGDAGGFSVKTAQPLALTVMTNPGSANQAVSAMGLPDDPDGENLLGRPLTVKVMVRDASGGMLRRSAIVELTGDKSNPFWIRYAD